MIIVGRPEEGVWLNPLEYLLNSDGSLMEFRTKEDAQKFLEGHGVEGDALEDSFVYEETDEQTVFK